MGFHAIMLKLLDEGGVDLKKIIRPRSPDEALPLMEALNLYASESAAVIYSHQSRGKAYVLMNEIDGY